MNISIVIPNYNGELLLKKNLPKVMFAVRYYREHSLSDIETVVVDDCSTDSSRVVLEKFDVKVLTNKKNLGFSSTANRGVKEATGDVVVLLNTDVSPEKDFLDPLLSNFNDPDVFAVGCMDKSIENGKVILRGRGIGRWERGFLVHNRGGVDKKNTLWVNGGSGAFRKSIWEKLGGFNELYNPFYWEDIDLSYRSLKSGYSVLFEPESVVIHEHEKGVIQRLYSPFQIKTIAYRNQFIFAWSNVDSITWHIAWLPYHMITAALRFDLAFLLGLLRAILLIPNIVQSANTYRKLFIRNDSEVIAQSAE